MMRTNSKRLRAALAVAGMMTIGLMAAPAAQALDKFTSTVDKREPAKTDSNVKTRTVLGIKAEDFKKLAEKKVVYVDIKILLDGKSRYQVLSSEAQDERRYNVNCQPGAYGRFPMNEGSEYYINTGDESGRRIDLSVFPGTRTANPDNDVSCVADSAHPNAAVLRVRGIYGVLTNDFGDRLVVELRPLTRESLSADDIKKLP